MEVNANQTHFLYSKSDSQVSRKESAFCIEGCADESAVRQSEGERAVSTAGSAKPCLSPLCQLSTFGHISAMWSCWAGDMPLIPD